MTALTNGHSRKIVRVGVIGCGEIVQVAHIPTLGFLSDRFQITYLCDVSDQALAYCQSKVIGGKPKTTRSAEELCASPEVDVVLIANSDAFHAVHTVTALRHHKFVLLEKPMALSLRDADIIMAAEKASSGKVMVGYMRRYASAFTDAIKEVGGLDKILYARVRDIVGPNSIFVGQSGTFPKTFKDYRAEDTRDLNRRTEDVLHQALELELGIPATPDMCAMWRNLGSLGSHDLSAMREVFGMPSEVLGASLCSSVGMPFWSALFQYPGFAVSYESGIDGVARFDASIEIFGEKKTVKICYDTPYVKGLPTKMEIRETTADGSFKESSVRSTYEDSYTLEMKELYSCVVEGKEIKTTVEDAKQDLVVFRMIMEAGVGRRSGAGVKSSTRIVSS
ncbi:NAD(P)-binding protein [Cadophora sp. DSE1049]|nr:NAD(P)-binding protein [Cadophora sp. DSE1049]